MITIRPYDTDDEQEVLALWERSEITRHWNDAARDIARKLRVQSEWFLVGLFAEGIVATVMAGYDGHRGWINYLAVDPAYRRQGLGRAMMKEAELRLLEFGCPKINLLIHKDNVDAIAFYKGIGFCEDDVVCVGKRLLPNA